MNPIGQYYTAAFRTALTSCFINGRIPEQQIDFAKEVISKFREAEIDHLAISASEKEELKRQWKQWLDATARGIKDELRGEGKLGELNEIMAFMAENHRRPLNYKPEDRKAWN